MFNENEIDENEAIVKDCKVTVHGDVVTVEPLDKKGGPAWTMTQEEFQVWRAKTPFKETPGYRYVAEYILPEYTEDMETDWLAEDINSGTLVVCPNCHFLRLPRAPFPWDQYLVSKHGDPGEAACDVCFHAVTQERLSQPAETLLEQLPQADQTLAELRARRARALYDLHHTGDEGGEALLLQSMAERVQSLQAVLPR